MDYNSYLSQIVAFNSDKKVVALREKFNRPSFFEIISKARSETIYSAFLKWLFQENIEDSTCSPLAYLLDVLVRRSEEQAVQTILKNDAKLKRCVVTRKLSIESPKVETEKSVSVLAQSVANMPNSNRELEKIAAKSKDRIDLFVECGIKCSDIEAQKLQIIIENKIDSNEGRAKKNETTGVEKYDKASQTTRYYLGTNICDKGILQLYVYLTPNEPSNADIDEHYIQISYQDIVDGILMPMLSSSSLPSRNRFFLEEFLNQLMYTSVDNKIMRSSIAIGTEYSEELSSIWEKYNQLLLDAAVVAAESELWKIGDHYYDHRPKNEVLSFLNEKNIKDDNIVNGRWKPNTHFAKIQDIAKLYGLDVIEVSLDVGEDCQNLLSSFWDENRRFLTTVINGMKKDERVKVEALLTEVSKRDTTKYNVYYNDKMLNEKPLGKAETAFCIVNKWVELKDKKVTLQDLRNAFPINYNPYYAQGKWFRYLFYDRDGENSIIYDGTEGNHQKPTSNWDFDSKGRYDICTEGGKVIFLKMWRKSCLEHFIKKVTDAKLFEGTINVVPVD